MCGSFADGLFEAAPHRHGARRPPPAPEVQLLSDAQLDQMLAPIALYPDPLLAEMLPAATLPSQIVLADRYVSGGGDPNLIDQQPWDLSVKALTQYPTVLRWMDDNLAWTTALGQAFLNQQQDVMNSIQRLRAQAMALGNLQSTPQQSVVVDNGLIEILPPNPQVIYVPVYQPNVVYYQRTYGTPFISFGAALRVGVWLNHDFDWRDHHIIVWHHNQPRPPDWWSRRPAQRPRPEAAHAAVWQPRARAGPRGRDIDRGWNTRPAPSTVTVIGAQHPPAEHHETQPAPAWQPQPAVVQHPTETTHSRQYSTRGQESRRAAEPHRASPPPRASAPAHSEAPNRSGGHERH